MKSLMDDIPVYTGTFPDKSLVTQVEYECHNTYQAVCGIATYVGYKT